MKSEDQGPRWAMALFGLAHVVLTTVIPFAIMILVIALVVGAVRCLL